MHTALRRHLLGVMILLGIATQFARAQNFRYEAEPRAGQASFHYAGADPAPRMSRPVRPVARPAAPPVSRAHYQSASAPAVSAAPRMRISDRLRAEAQARQSAKVTRRDHFLRPTAGAEPIPAGQPLDPFAEELPPGGPVEGDVYYDGPPTMDATLQPEPMLDEGAFYSEPVAPMPCCEDGSCANCSGGPIRHWLRNTACLARNGAYSENFSLFTGKQGFKGPVDQGVNGNFGYHGGGNWGMPLIDARGIGYQIGVNYIGSDFAGRTGPLGHRRAQFFVTTGAFRRAVCGQGFQYGAVLDYLRDDFYIQMDLTQVRGEIGYVYHGHELGFWGAFTGNTSTHWGDIPNNPWQSYSFEATSQYNIFYRYESPNGTVCRTWGGLSGHGDGIFGGDMTVRLTNTLGVVANYNYLLPRNDDNVPNNVKESWNLTISCVWYPGYKRCDSWTNPYRPLFYVADNGWFMTRQANSN
jgi:hypothetical protein